MVEGGREGGGAWCWPRRVFIGQDGEWAVIQSMIVGSLRVQNESLAKFRRWNILFVTFESKPGPGACIFIQSEAVSGRLTVWRPCVRCGRRGVAEWWRPSPSAPSSLPPTTPRPCYCSAAAGPPGGEGRHDKWGLWWRWLDQRKYGRTNGDPELHTGNTAANHVTSHVTVSRSGSNWTTGRFVSTCSDLQQEVTAGCHQLYRVRRWKRHLQPAPIIRTTTEGSTPVWTGQWSEQTPTSGKRSPRRGVMLRSSEPASSDSLNVTDINHIITNRVIIRSPLTQTGGSRERGSRPVCSLIF